MKIYIVLYCTISESHSEPNESSKIELLAKIINGFVTIFAETFILDVCLNTSLHLQRHFKNDNKKVGSFTFFQ